VTARDNAQFARMVERIKELLEEKRAQEIPTSMFHRPQAE